MTENLQRLKQLVKDAGFKPVDQSWGGVAWKVNGLTNYGEILGEDDQPYARHFVVLKEFDSKVVPPETVQRLLEANGELPLVRFNLDELTKVVRLSLVVEQELEWLDAFQLAEATRLMEEGFNHYFEVCRPPAPSAKPYERLSTLPVVDIEGVVDSRGAWSSWSADGCTLMVEFQAWKVAGGELQERTLVVRKIVTEEEATTYRDLLPCHGQVSFRARLADEPSMQMPWALLESVEGPGADPALADCAARLRTPVVREDPLFGTLTFDRSHEWFSAEPEWDGREVSLALSATEADLAKALEAARALWSNQRSWRKRVLDYAVKALLPVKNASWVDDSGKVSANVFRQRLELTSITVFPDETWEFWFDDGDMFGGHSVVIYGSLSEGPTSSDLPG